MSLATAGKWTTRRLLSPAQQRCFSKAPCRCSSNRAISEANNTPHLSFRSFISALREQGDLVDVKEPVSADLEAAAVTRRVYEKRAPAPLFHDVIGIDPKTGLFRILGAPVGLRKNKKDQYGRLALQLGLPATSTAREIVEKMIAAKEGTPLPPVVVDRADAPCKENILKGSEVDMTKWPIPRLHELDGGNYLATYGFHIVQTPDKSWVSWSISRAMHLAGEPRALTAPVLKGQHIHAVRQRWIDAGEEKTPWALVLGGPPAAAFVAGMPLPYEVNEDGYVGALSGSPLEVVKCETNDLYVPANSEIVLEGHISNSKTVPEGPMGEYHGYAFKDKPVMKPLFHVDCVTYRKNPVVPICVAGLPPDETHTVWGPSISAELLSALRKAGFPVNFVWLPLEALCIWIFVSVDTKKLASMNISPEELCKRAGELIFGTHAGWEIPKVFLVGDDVDITDINQVLWALSTRYRPGADEYIFDDATGLPLLPYMMRATRKEVPDPGKGGKSVVNLLLPEEFDGERNWLPSNFEGSYPEDIKETVLSKWEKYGYAEDE
ncbi:hypothetical protein DTO271D3_5445 [Paecilomyces variotii]|nr:hypothetical protein DTO271D3_5445 [Paecilomyces variotii]